jgi:hypothetical protein
VNSFLNLTKDWLPSIAVIVGGAWLLFQWLFGESLRREKESPALDGKLSATTIQVENGWLLVTVEALWNNRSPLPIKLDIHKTHIDVFRIDSDRLKENSALVVASDLGQPIVRNAFLEGMVEVDYSLEPRTASTIVNYFVLKPGIYAVRMQLHGPKMGSSWWKELIVDARPSSSAKTEEADSSMAKSVS